MTISVDALGQPLAGADVKRHVGPAPVVELQLQRHEGFDVRMRIDKLFAAIGGNVLAVDRALAILAAHGARENVLGLHGLNGVQHFRLLVANGIGLK